MGDLKKLLKRAAAAQQKKRRRELRREFCRWIEDEFGIEEYRYFAVNEEERCVSVKDQLAFVSVIGESRAAYVSVISKYCCGEPDSLHEIGIVRTLAELGALIKPNAAGQPRFECQNCQGQNSSESPTSAPVAETAAEIVDQDWQDDSSPAGSPPESSSQHVTQSVS